MGNQSKVKKFQNDKAKPYARLRPNPKRSRRFPSKWKLAGEIRGLGSDLDKKKG